MRKGVTFISAVLTAFVLATLAGVVYAYKDLSSVSSTKPQPSAGLQSVSLPLAAPTATQVVYPQEAADIAAKYLKRTDLYSVELANFNGAQTYLVTFASGDTVYVSMAGQVLSAVPPQTVTYSAPAKKKKNGGGGGGGGGGEGGGSEGGGGGDD